MNCSAPIHGPGECTAKCPRCGLSCSAPDVTLAASKLDYARRQCTQCNDFDAGDAQQFASNGGHDPFREAAVIASIVAVLVVIAIAVVALLRGRGGA